jgi:hypothetical protein
MNPLTKEDLTKKVLIKLYQKQKLQQREIAKMFNCSVDHVRRLRKKIGMPTRRVGMQGRKHSMATIIKMRQKGAIRMSKVLEPNRPEKKMMEILGYMGIKYKFHVPIRSFIDNTSEDEITACVDFLIFQKENPKTKWPMIIIQVDGRYHHNLKDNIEHDNLQDRVFVTHGFIVLHLWDDEIMHDKVKGILEYAENLDSPAVIRYYFPDEYKKYCPAEYLRKNKKIIHRDIKSYQ